MEGIFGVEPKVTESESIVLPLHYIPTDWQPCLELNQDNRIQSAMHYHCATGLLIDYCAKTTLSLATSDLK